MVLWGSVVTLVLWGRPVLGCQKVPRKVPPRFRGRFRQGFTKVSPRFHQGSTKLLQISWCLWLSGADLSWAAKKFRLGLPKSSAEGSPRFHRGSTKVPSRFHQGSAKVPPRLYQSLTNKVPLCGEELSGVSP